MGVMVADVLHERLDQLCDAVYESRQPRPTKKRMLSAIILAAASDTDELTAMLAQFDACVVRDALLEQQTGDVVELRARRPGPHSHRKSP